MREMEEFQKDIWGNSQVTGLSAGSIGRMEVLLSSLNTGGYAGEVVQWGQTTK